MSVISEYKTYLWDYLEKYHNVTSPKRFFHCLNPNHIDNNPSMMFTDKYNICKCFSCGASYDIYDLIGLDYDLHSFKEQLEKVQELYLGYIPVKKEVKKDIDNKVYDYTNYYNKCFKNRYRTTYLEQRGITRELIDKYKIGYDEERKLVVFPINKHCYFARSVVNNDKIKSKGSSDIWNKRYIKENNQLVYVTEGIIDALSLEVIDPNVKVMSINGVGNINSLVYALKENNFNGTIGIAFDKDGAGKKATDELKKELAKININSFSTSMIATFDDTSKVKDINMALIDNKDLLKRNYEYINSALLQCINKEKEGDGIEYQ